MAVCTAAVTAVVVGIYGHRIWLDRRCDGVHLAVTAVVGVLPERHLLSPKWVRPMCTATVTYEFSRAVKALCRRIDLE